MLVPVGYFDESPILILGEWDVPRYSRYRITKGIYEYYPYSRFLRSLDSILRCGAVTT